MKLLNHGLLGNERAGAVDATGCIRDLSAYLPRIDGAALSAESLATLRSINLNKLPIVPADTRLGPCVINPQKFICIGLNYADHAAETHAAIPAEPIVFMKATSAVCGPNDPIIQPRSFNKPASKLDWEVELAVVIGSPCKYVDEIQAAQAIAGFCVCNDISERELQTERGGQWTKGKSNDNFGPIGPWLVTADEVNDVENLSMWLDVNGVKRQRGSTQTMIFKPAFLVSYLSQFMTLLPGDIISTGTPPGVGLGMKPPTYLQLGDVVTLGIAGLGTQRQTVIAAEV